MSISTDPVEARPRARRTPPPRWILWSLRATATLHLLGVLVQAVLAGMFVTGDVDMLTWHRDNGGFTYGMLFFQVVAAILLWRPGRGPAWPALATGALAAPETLQVMLGQERVLIGHFPIGVLDFGASAVLAWWAWTGLRTEGA
ncbi:hypothetical protein GCM10010466_51190 [Planomonospora alba]|uniref:Uncharacterized protein n=1 Tax=Planomonospora alba TaxID=161354 RepID=A0ABP6NNM3_9ACTN